MKLYLKPQDSFGEFNNFFLYLQKVQEIIRKHHQIFLAYMLVRMAYCNAILPSVQIIVMLHNLWQSVSGGLHVIFMFLVIF